MGREGGNGRENGVRVEESEVRTERGRKNNEGKKKESRDTERMIKDTQIPYIVCNLQAADTNKRWQHQPPYRMARM